MVEKKERRSINLALPKFIELLDTHGYTLVSVYGSSRTTDTDQFFEGRFIEIRTPKYQKTFIVYLPEKYSMKVDGETHRRLEIARSPQISELPPRALAYLLEMKGPLLECDLLSVSSTDLVLLRHNGDALIFTIGEARKPKMYSPPPDVEEDTLDNLEKQAAQIKTRLEPAAEVPEITKDTDEHYELTIVDPTDELTLNDDGERVIVELDFQDEDGESIQEAVNELMIHDVDVPKSQSRVPLGSTKNGVKEDGKKVTDNSLPVDLEDNEIELGIIYATIEINTFYKKIATLESEIVGYYDILDENEAETRVARLKKITDLSGLLVKRASDELEKIKAEETAIRGQLVRLTTLLTQTETFRENSKDLKYSDIKPDIEKVHTQTRKSIHDVNLELLRLRDRADEVLSDYQTTLEDLLVV